MSENFYRAFEDRHRGSRELISSRQHIYLPFIKPFLTLRSECQAADLGCGRGEWLELLVSCGFRAQGIDLDKGMLEACIERGLPASQNDAVTFLKGLEDNSQAVVSGFHIAEHVPFSYLQTMVAEALRVLIPGGILILETPNAENLVVGTNNFYLDPTHERPLPYQLLSFLTEYTGFHRSKLLRLQEPAQLHDENHIVDLMAVFSAVSPDYAIVAQKFADEATLVLFDDAYQRVYGLSLEALTSRYEKTLAGKLSAIDAQLNLIDAQRNEYTNRFNVLESRLNNELAVAHQQAQAHERHINAIMNSTSWKITKPMRVGVRFSLRTLRFSKRIAKSALKASISRLLAFVISRPLLRTRLSQIVKKVPGLHERLSQIEAAGRPPVVGRSAKPFNGGQQPISRRADAIYKALEKSAESRNED
jgi:O-antigen chain-terminating methyltransferase